MSDIKTFVASAITRSPKINPNTGALHLVRSAGSFIPGKCLTDEDARAYLSALDWNELSKADCDAIDAGIYHPAGIARYFQAQLPEVAIQGIALKRDIPVEKISWEKGSHNQMELVAKVPTKETTLVSLIVGPGEDGEIVWTWFPGQLTPFVPVNPETPISEIPDNATVKLAWS